MKSIRALAAASLIAVSVALAPAALAFDGLCRSVAIQNDDARAILSVRMTHIDDDDWGRDLLGDELIEVGDWAVVTPDNDEGYCRFDLRFTYTDGTQRVVKGLNACEAYRLNVFEDAIGVTGVDGEGTLIDA